MKKFLNTLFVTTQGAYLNKEGEAVIISVEKEVKLRLPIHTLGGIVCFGNVMCSPFLLGHCAENNVAVSFLTERGRFLARVHGPVSGNVLLRREQYRRADDPASSLSIAQAVVTAKVANARNVLQRAMRDHADKENVSTLEPSVIRLGRIVGEVQQCQEMEQLRGREGDAGREYFGAFDHLITAQKNDFYLRDRNRRPPLDSMKTLLIAYQKRKQEEIKHPYLDETIPIGLLFYAQALLLARHLRGDLDGYPPFIWK